VIVEGLKLTLYFGERDRVGDRFLADVLVDIYERHGLAASVTLRAIEGFGLRHHLHTDRLLTLSEDLPLVSVAVDRRDRIEAALPEVREAMGDGLITLERARLLAGEGIVAPQNLDPAGAAKLTVYAGRGQRNDRRPAHLQALRLLRAHGVTGASLFHAVDGTRHGQRRRARFFSRNVEVPSMLLAAGPATAVEGALPELAALFRDPLVTLERVRVVKRDGARLADPLHVSERDDAGLPVWQKLMVHAEQLAKTDGRPLHVELVRRLRATGAAGATVLRGAVGYYGGHEPFRDRFLTVRRNVPVTTVIVDTPDRVRGWWHIVDEVTRESGLVTSEPVPATHAKSRDAQRGRLATATIRRLMEEDQTPPI
jgi:PII-like signaling protein